MKSLHDRVPARTRSTGGPSKLIVIAALAACAGGSEKLAIRSDSAGIQIVVSGAEDIRLDWRVSRILDVGGEGNFYFHRVYPTSVGTDSTGNLYILDAGNYYVLVLNRAGREVNRMGRQGNGPGEMGFPTDMAVGPDGTVAVWDFSVGGFLRYAPDGAILPVMKYSGALQRQLAVTAGGILGVFRSRAAEDDSVMSRLLLLSATDTSEITASGEPAPRMVEFDCMAFAIPPYLAPGVVWSAGYGRVVARAAHEYDVRIYDGTRLAASWRRPIPVLDATLELAMAEAPADSFRMMSAAGTCAVSSREAVEKIGYSAHAPLIAGLHVAPDGTVWVRRRTGVARRFLIDVFDRTGEYQGTLPEDMPWPAVFRGPDEIVTVENDSLDIPHVMVYRVLRNAGR